jgi:hypothetical protein
LSRFWNQTRSTLPKKLTDTHEAAKQRIVEILEARGYYCEEEWQTPPLNHKGEPVRFPVDIYAAHPYNGNRILVQVDGEVHRHSRIQLGKTTQRDETLQQFSDENGFSYAALGWVGCVQDILHELSEDEICVKLGLEKSKP